MVDDRWLKQIIEEAHDFFTEADKREQAAEQRGRDLGRVHQEGWRELARAVDTGLKAIADAIRDRR